MLSQWGLIPAGVSPRLAGSSPRSHLIASCRLFRTTGTRGLPRVHIPENDLAGSAEPSKVARPKAVSLTRTKIMWR
jgi:hypothetical protein